MCWSHTQFFTRIEIQIWILILTVLSVSQKCVNIWHYVPVCPGGGQWLGAGLLVSILMTPAPSRPTCRLIEYPHIECFCQPPHWTRGLGPRYRVPAYLLMGRTFLTTPTFDLRLSWTCLCQSDPNKLLFLSFINFWKLPKIEWFLHDYHKIRIIWSVYLYQPSINLCDSDQIILTGRSPGYRRRAEVHC